MFTKQKLNYILIIIWLITAVITMFHHELWRDEARVWWIVKENLGLCFSLIKNDGHPFLWYLLSMPFSRIGLNPLFLQILSLLAVFSAVCLFCFKSKFNFINKILFIFSSGMIYFLPIVARNYSLIPITLFLIAYIYPKRLEKPYLYTLLIMLLSQTHVLVWGVCAILWLFFAFEVLSKYNHSEFKKKIIGYIPIILFVLYLIFMAFVFQTDRLEAKKAFEPITMDFFYNLKSVILYKVLDFPYNVKMIYLYSALFLSLAILKTNAKVFCILIFSISFILFILIQVWFGGVPYQKFYIITLIFVFCCMLIPLNSKVNNILVQCLLFVFLLTTNYMYNPLNIVKEDIDKKFTNTKDVYNLLKDKDVKENEYLIIELNIGFSADTFIAYGLKTNNFLVMYKEKNINYDDYKNRIEDKIKQNSEIRYIIINNEIDYLKNIYTEKEILPILVIKQENQAKINDFSSYEFYNVYKLLK